MGRTSSKDYLQSFFRLNYISTDMLCCNDNRIVIAPWFMVTCMIPIIGKCQQREEKLEFKLLWIQGSYGPYMRSIKGLIQPYIVLSWLLKHGSQISVHSLWQFHIIRIDNLHSKFLCFPLRLVLGGDGFCPRGAKCSICLWLYPKAQIINCDYASVMVNFVYQLG